MTPLDHHGQAINPAFNQRRRTERDLSEMLGLVKGILSDGVVNDDEARYLKDWGRNHPDALHHWPVDLIFSRLQAFFADGRIDDAERLQLQEILAALVGGAEAILLGYEGATTLPLDQPPPTIVWAQTEVFVFTGRFAFGTRADCEQEVCRRGATCAHDITKRTTFLVVGTFGSEDWAHTSYGRKIQHAVDIRKSGVPLKIVGEDHWATALAVGASR